MVRTVGIPRQLVARSFPRGSPLSEYFFLMSASTASPYFAKLIGAGFADYGLSSLSGYVSSSWIFLGDFPRESFSVSSSVILSAPTITRSSRPAWMAYVLSTPGYERASCSRSLSRLMYASTISRRAPGACARDGVAYLHDGGEKRSLLHLVVMGADGVADVGFFLELFCEFHAEQRVGVPVRHQALCLCRVADRRGGPSWG